MSHRPLLFVALVLTAACTEYEFSKDGDHAAPRDTLPEDTFDTGSTPPPDSGAAPDTDTGVAPPPPDTGTGSPPPPDTGTPPTDTCFEPEDGYEQNPAAKILVSDGTVPVTVTLVSSSTSYQDVLYLDAPESVLLAYAWSDAPGTSRTLGPYTSGSELVFGIYVENTGDHWKSGPGARNDDDVVHVSVTYEGDCSWLIGFEDLRGGGDLDYNDVVLRVQGMLRQER